MIPVEIVRFIEENVDEDPETLLNLVKIRFKDQCNNSDVPCLCQMIGKIILLYQQKSCEKVTSEMHQRLIEIIKHKCK